MKSEIKMGAIDKLYVHQSPFMNLPILVNSQASTLVFYEKWVIPFYTRSVSEPAFQTSYRAIRKDCDIQVVTELLGGEDWRTRSAGAYFAAIEQFAELEEAIGNLLLRSETYSGVFSYCLALAAFNTSQSLKFLQKHLNYYLKQKEGWFNQHFVFTTVAYLDQLNGTNKLASHLSEWQEFSKNKPYFNLAHHVENFSNTMKAISLLRTTN